MDRIINCSELENKIEKYYIKESARIDENEKNDRTAFRLLTALEVRELKEKEIISNFLELCRKYEM